MEFSVAKSRSITCETWGFNSAMRSFSVRRSSSVKGKSTPPGRTITQQDNAWFTLLTMNTHPLHFDEEYAKETEFGRPLVASPLTVAILVGMSVSDVSERAIANLGWKEIRLTAPVFPGDTLYAESEVIDKRESKSRPNAGIVSVRTTGTNQDGTVVCVFDRTMLIPKKPAADAASEA